MTTGPNPSQPPPPNTPPIPRYSVNEYVKYATSVKKSNEWIIEYFQTQLTNVQKQLEIKEGNLEDKVSKLAEKDIKLKLAEQELSQLKDISITQFGLGLVSALLTGFGINYATSTPPVEAGKWMIGAAVIMQLLSLVITLLAKFRGSRP